MIRARDRTLDRVVALKLLDRLEADGEARSRFLREARLTARLSHPSIVVVFDCGISTEGVPYIVYELVDGPDLDRVRGEGPVDLDRLRTWMGSVAEALAAAHAEGVVHRDVKPSNILLRDGDEAVLADFGIAASSSSLTRMTAEGMVLGTPAYLAPEILGGEPHTPASDQFGLAATTLVLATGRFVYGTDLLRGVLDAAHDRTPDPAWFRVARRGLEGTGLGSREIEALVRALSPHPGERLAGIGVLAQALDGAGAPEAPVASRVLPSGGGRATRGMAGGRGAAGTSGRSVATQQFGNVASLGGGGTVRLVASASPGRNDSSEPDPVPPGRSARGRAWILGVATTVLGVLALAAATRGIGPVEVPLPPAAGNQVDDLLDHRSRWIWLEAEAGEALLRLREAHFEPHAGEYRPRDHRADPAGLRRDLVLPETRRRVGELLAAARRILESELRREPLDEVRAEAALRSVEAALQIFQHLVMDLTEQRRALEKSLVPALVAASRDRADDLELEARLFDARRSLHEMVWKELGSVLVDPRDRLPRLARTWPVVVEVLPRETLEAITDWLAARLRRPVPGLAPTDAIHLAVQLASEARTREASTCAALLALLREAEVSLGRDQDWLDQPGLAMVVLRTMLMAELQSDRRCGGLPLRDGESRLPRFLGLWSVLDYLGPWVGERIAEAVRSARRDGPVGNHSDRWFRDLQCEAAKRKALGDEPPGWEGWTPIAIHTTEDTRRDLDVWLGHHFRLLTEAPPGTEVPAAWVQVLSRLPEWTATRLADQLRGGIGFEAPTVLPLVECLSGPVAERLQQLAGRSDPEAREIVARARSALWRSDPIHGETPPALLAVLGSLAHSLAHPLGVWVRLRIQMSGAIPEALRGPLKRATLAPPLARIAAQGCEALRLDYLGHSSLREQVELHLQNQGGIWLGAVGGGYFLVQAAESALELVERCPGGVDPLDGQSVVSDLRQLALTRTGTDDPDWARICARLPGALRALEAHPGSEAMADGLAAVAAGCDG